MPFVFAAGWLQAGDIGNLSQQDLQQLTVNFANTVNLPAGNFQTPVQALAYNIINNQGNVTVLRAPHQIEQYDGHTWVHYTLRSTAASTSYHLYLHTDPSAHDNIEPKVYVVSSNSLQAGIVWESV